MKTEPTVDQIAELRQRWPLAFNDSRKPLKVGVDVDMGLVNRSEAMRQWVLHPQYLRNVISGGERIDLNGEPAGVISKYEREDAWETLRWRRTDLYDARERRKRPHEYQPHTGLTLADERKELALSMPRFPKVSRSKTEEG